MPNILYDKFIGTDKGYKNMIWSNSSQGNGSKKEVVETNVEKSPSQREVLDSNLCAAELPGQVVVWNQSSFFA